MPDKDETRAMRERLLLGLGLVGAATIFFALVARRRGYMSFPCPTCGRRDDLAVVDPIGIHMDKAILWQCRCGNTRAVLIDHRIPSSLVKKVLALDAGSNQP